MIYCWPALGWASISVLRFKAKVVFVHNQQWNFSSLAAACTNGLSYGRVVARVILRLPQFSCCERAAHENRIHAPGPERSFAARCTKVCSAEKRTFAGAAIDDADNFAFAASIIWQCDICHRTSRSNGPISLNLKRAFRCGLHPQSRLRRLSLQVRQWPLHPFAKSVSQKTGPVIV